MILIGQGYTFPLLYNDDVLIPGVANAHNVPLADAEQYLPLGCGEITIDQGAEQAILKNGKSLLPSGIIDIQGRFSMGSVVVLKNGKGTDIAIGLVNYSSDDLLQIKGAKTSAIEAILGYKHDDEVIHRDNLVPTELLGDTE